MMKKMFVVFTGILCVLLIGCSPEPTKKIIKKPRKEIKPESKVLKIAKQLVKEKGNVNQRYDSRYKKNDTKIPILVWAISHQDVPAVKFLLDNGADPNIKVLERSTDPAIFEAITSVILDPPTSKLYRERRSKSFKICELLLNAGADVKYKNKLGVTALHTAAGKGREDICLLLISKGAKSTVEDRLGTTPLHDAAKYGYWKVVAVLLRNGANVNAKDKFKQTPLKLAEQRCDEDLHKKCRKEIPNCYDGAGYDKTIKVLRSSGGRK